MTYMIQMKPLWILKVNNVVYKDTPFKKDGAKSRKLVKPKKLEDIKPDDNGKIRIRLEYLQVQLKNRMCLLCQYISWGYRYCHNPECKADLWAYGSSYKARYRIMFQKDKIDPNNPDNDWM